MKVDALAFAIQTGCFFLASLINFSMLLSSGAILFILPKISKIKSSIIEGFPLFVSSAGISLFTNSNAVILGFVSTEAAVGYFVAAFTLVKAVVGLSGPVGQALFPRVASHFASNSDTLGPFLKQSLLMQALLGTVLSLALVFFLPWGITWFYGASFAGAIVVMAWLSFLPLIICISSTFGLQTLVPLGRGRWFSSVLLLSGLLNCVLIFPFGYFWGATGGAIAVLITECTILAGMALGLKRLEPKIWKSMVPFA